MHPGAVLHGHLSIAGVLRGRGSRGAPQGRRAVGVPGGPELLAALSPPSSLQVSAWLS